MSAHPDCTKCKRHTGAVLVGMDGNGDANPDILVVWPQVTHHDERDGVVGSRRNGSMARFGPALEQLRSVGLKIRHTSAVRCANTTLGQYGPENIKPSMPEYRQCSTWLTEERIEHRPPVTLLLGADVAKSVLGYKVGSVASMRLRPTWVDDQVFVVTYNPSTMIPRDNDNPGYRGMTAEQYTQAISEDLIKAGQIAQGLRTGNTQAIEAHKHHEVPWRVAESEADVLYALQKIRETRRFSADIETNTWEGSPVSDAFSIGFKVTCIGLNWGEESLIIPLDMHLYHPEIRFRPSDLWARAFIEELLSMDLTQGYTQIWQNGAYDLVGLFMRYGVLPYRWYRDTLQLSRLIRSDRAHDLDSQAQRYTTHGGYSNEITQAVAELPPGQKGYHLVNPMICFRKCAYDVNITLTVEAALTQELVAWPNLEWIYHNNIVPRLHETMEMSINGQEIDDDERLNYKAHLEGKVAQIHQIIRQFPSVKRTEEDFAEKSYLNRKKYQVFNPGSGDHRIMALFVHEGLPVDPKRMTKPKNGKSLPKPQTDKKVLAKLAETNELAFCLKRYSQYEALLNKMVNAIPRWREHTFDGRLHGQFNVGGTRTGRDASKKPNMQNLASGNDSDKGMPNIPVMRCFKARAGKIYLYADISQAELRTAAHVTQEPALMETFQQGLDYHAAIARDLFGISYDEAKKNDAIRRKIKCLAEGTLILTKYRGEVEIQNVTCYDKVWDGEQWVSHDGVIYTGEKEVITHDGLTATAEHLVWLEDGSCCHLAQAMAQGSRLAVGSREGVPIRYAPGYLRQNPHVWGQEIQSRVDPMPTMWASQGDPNRQYLSWENQGLSEVLQHTGGRSSGRRSAGQVRDDHTTMPKPRQRELAQLRWSGNRMPVQVVQGIHPLLPGAPTSPDVQQNGYWSNRQQRPLRTREHTPGNQVTKPEKHQSQCVDRLLGGKTYNSGPVGSSKRRLPKFQTVLPVDSKSIITRGAMVKYIRKETPRALQEKVRTYDIVNAGPNHRFTANSVVVSNSFNFGLFYGLSPIGLAEQATIPLEEAKDIFRRYFERFTMVDRNLFQPTKEQVMRQGYTLSEFGRPWWNDLDLRDKRQRERAFRQAINFRIQSTSAEIVFCGFRTFLNARNERYTREQVMIVNNIHDSLIVECDEALVQEVGQLMIQCLENPIMPFGLSIPWVADLKTGYRLGKNDLWAYNPYTNTLTPSKEQIEIYQVLPTRRMHRLNV